jgi:hypothetical protein
MKAVGARFFFPSLAAFLPFFATLSFFAGLALESRFRFCIPFES